MFDLKRTTARAEFKDVLGHANHFVITILVGLNGVKNGVIAYDDEFHTAWNPRSVRASAERSRVFALDMALIRAVDALDTYMMRSRRRPCALKNDMFAARMDATGQSVARRLDVFSEFLPVLSVEQPPFLKLAIDWRNRRVHSLAVESLQRSDEATLLANAQTIEAEHKGLIIKELLGRFKTGSAPTFKDAASIISLVHRVVQHFDTQLLFRVGH